MASDYFIKPGQPIPGDCIRKLAHGAEIVFGDRAESVQRDLRAERGGRDNGLVSIAAVRAADLKFPPTIMQRAVLTSAHTLPFAPRDRDDANFWGSNVFGYMRLAGPGEMAPLGRHYLIAEDSLRDGMLMIQWGNGVDSAQVLRVAREIEQEIEDAAPSFRNYKLTTVKCPRAACGGPIRLFRLPAGEKSQPDCPHCGHLVEVYTP